MLTQPFVINVHCLREETHRLRCISSSPFFASLLKVDPSFNICQHILLEFIEAPNLLDTHLRFVGPRQASANTIAIVSLLLNGDTCCCIFFLGLPCFKNALVLDIVPTTKLVDFYKFIIILYSSLSLPGYAHNLYSKERLSRQKWDFHLRAIATVLKTSPSEQSQWSLCSWRDF